MTELFGPDEPVYIISIVARYLQVSQQTLRFLEKQGLVCPSRTEHNTRLYSRNDVELLGRICFLLRERKVNLAGIRLILDDERGSKTGGETNE